MLLCLHCVLCLEPSCKVYCYSYSNVLQGWIALQSVVQCACCTPAWLYERLATGAFWEDVKSTWCVFNMEGDDQRSFSLSPDCWGAAGGRRCYCGGDQPSLCCWLCTLVRTACVCLHTYMWILDIPSLIMQLLSLLTVHWRCAAAFSDGEQSHSLYLTVNV